MNVLIFLFLTIAALGYAQKSEDVIVSPQEFLDRYPSWISMHGSFLEPNRFGISYDATPKRILLEAGYGGDLVRFGVTGLGAEILIWSGLKTLPGFRFPVETADYFFGVYASSPVWLGFLRDLIRIRFRLSHISSHYVDGTTDTLVGGSSSKFSREFVSLEALYDNTRNRRLAISAGLKYVFHQVNDFEPTLQFPIGIDYRLFKLGRKDDLTLYVSTAAGPSLPVFAGGIVFQHQTVLDQAVKIFAEYHTGHSRYGVDGNAKEHGYQIGIRLSPKN